MHYFLEFWNAGNLVLAPNVEETGKALAERPELSRLVLHHHTPFSAFKAGTSSASLSSDLVRGSSENLTMGLRL